MGNRCVDRDVVISPAYPGKLGVVEEGALAQLLLINCDPIANSKLLEDPSKNFAVIMKDGKIYKKAMPLTAPSNYNCDVAPSGT